MKKYITSLTIMSGLAAVIMTTAADKKETKAYPLQTCVVSDEKLDSMGKPYVFTNDTIGSPSCATPSR